MQKRYIVFVGILVVAAVAAWLLRAKPQQQPITSNDNASDGSVVHNLPGTSPETTEYSGQTTVTSADNAPPGSIHNLPVPKPVAAVRTYVAQGAKLNESEVIILEAHERNWPDACLGLGSSQELCAQVMTPGYLVKLTAKGQEFTYRTNEDGTVIRAE